MTTRLLTESPFPVRQAADPPAETVTIIAGGQQKQYIPDSRKNVKEGTVIEVHFDFGLHTFTESTEAEPCKPKPGGYNSGNLTFELNQTFVEVFQFIKPDDKLMVIYCGTGRHCNLGQVAMLNEERAKTAEPVNDPEIRGGKVFQIPLEKSAIKTPGIPEDKAGGKKEKGGEKAAAPGAEKLVAPPAPPPAAGGGKKAPGKKEETGVGAPGGAADAPTIGRGVVVIIPGRT
ncbi:hypothetical protein CDD83_4683 [Cordyceps sp. RAO-2017]|nr:hypothetical protein CDD83_4683 [Cordyceps sp. RAO-2017]